LTPRLDKVSLNARTKTQGSKKKPKYENERHTTQRDSQDLHKLAK